jgi:hypothetical protein
VPVILFLDFDGVLHPDPAMEEDAFQSKELLWKILRECPNVLVVFSTSWRVKRSLESLITLITTGGGEDVAERFVGVTPVIAPQNIREDYRRREIECLAWLDANGKRGDRKETPIPWLALDDVAYWFRLPCSNLYHVNHKTGLTSEDVPKIIERLQAF